MKPHFCNTRIEATFNFATWAFKDEPVHDPNTGQRRAWRFPFPIFFPISTRLRSSESSHSRCCGYVPVPRGLDQAVFVARLLPSGHRTFLVPRWECRHLVASGLPDSRKYGGRSRSHRASVTLFAISPTSHRRKLFAQVTFHPRSQLPVVRCYLEANGNFASARLIESRIVAEMSPHRAGFNRHSLARTGSHDFAENIQRAVLVSSRQELGKA